MQMCIYRRDLKKKKAMIFITYYGLRFSSAFTKNLLTEIYKGLGFGSLPKYNLEILEKAKYKDRKK